MRTQFDLDEFIPTMDAPDKVYQLFSSLGFNVLDVHLKTNPSVYNLPAKEAALVEKIFAVSNYDRRFQILLFKFKAGGPEQSRREAIRTIPEKILREVDFPFIIFTSDFNTYTFTLVEKVREGPGEFKRKLTKLIVDRNNVYHTDKETLRGLLLKDDVKNSVEIYNIFKEAFRVKRVTDAFFDEYYEVFKHLTKKFTEQNKHLKFTLFSRDGSVENFVKILLGRLMFLYFIQKRGWLNCFDGWGSGDKKFLYNKFQEAKKEKRNYFKDYLEPLFFDTLNNPRRDKPDQATQFGGRIPFLNGGLFEPEYDYTDVRNRIFLDNSTFDNVFSVFEKYNFTVKEDEPLEKEVAIDPEMLGKVFENLLEENLRKGKGSYYTPREIVHYMCHESLINYLASEVGIEQEEVRNFLDREQSLEKKETLSPIIRGKAEEIDEKLADIKVLDPACGSGAFLVGMLHEVINAHLSLNRELGHNLSEYELKKATIQNNIYGVDIDPGATEIAKLRLWLTLVVDHNLSEIEPLPNLDYKIMVGNSLIEEITINGKSIKLFNYNFFRKIQGKKMKNLFEKEIQKDLFDDLHWQNIQAEVEQIIKKKKLLFNTFEFEEKQKLRREIDNLENEIIRKSLRHEDQLLKERIQYECQKSELRIDKQNKELLNIRFSKNFLDDLINNDKKLNEYKSGNLFLWKLRFIEVFDEKDGFDIVIANPPYIRQEKITEYKKDLEKMYSVFSARSDLYTYFYERGINLLTNNGILTFISSNKFMRAKYGEKLRNYLQQNTQLLEIVDFGDEHKFEAVTNTLILITRKKATKNTIFKYSNVIGSDKINCFQADLSSNSWTLSDKKTLDLKNKIEGLGVPLSEWKIRISYGIKAGYNEAFILDKKIRDDFVRINPATETVIKPLLRGRDIGRYNIKFADKYIIISKYCGHNDLQNNFPGICRYLNRFKLELQNRGQVKNGQHHWLELDNNPQDSYLELFNQNKIIWIELSDKNKFTYTENKEFILAGAFMITGEALKYLLSFLNSKLCLFYFNLICNSSGMDTTQWKKFVIDKMPVKRLLDEEQKPFIKIVDKILAITKSDGYLTNSAEQAKVREYENQIDQMVYKLYGLTDEEIKIIEKSVK